MTGQVGKPAAQQVTANSTATHGVAQDGPVSAGVAAVTDAEWAGVYARIVQTAALPSAISSSSDGAELTRELVNQIMATRSEHDAVALGLRNIVKAHREATGVAQLQAVVHTAPAPAPSGPITDAQSAAIIKLFNDVEASATGNAVVSAHKPPKEDVSIEHLNNVLNVGKPEEKAALIKFLADNGIAVATSSSSSDAAREALGRRGADGPTDAPGAQP